MTKSLVFTVLFFTILTLNIHSQITASKQVSKFTIEAPQLDTNKIIWIFLPKSYQNTEKAYPVFYMHNSQNLFDDKTSFVGEWKVDENLDPLIEF